MEKPSVSVVLALIACLLMSACASEPPTAEQLQIMQPRPASFAGAMQLTPGPAGSELLYYQNLDAESFHYDSIIIEPIVLWCGDMTLDISPEDQFILSVYLYKVLRSHLARNFRIADKPGPGVMRLRVVFVDPGNAADGMLTVSAMPPPQSLKQAVANLSGGAYAFIGAAQSEGVVTDSITGARLLAWIDRRVGGGSLKLPVLWQWGDAHAAVDYWAETLSARLTQWHYQNSVAG